MPTKIIKPSDSIFYIASEIIALLKERKCNLDDIIEELNKRGTKKIRVEIIILSIDFLFMLGKVKLEDETIILEIE